MHRTNIYLEDVQQDALRQIAASGRESMSDVIRRAIDRLLADEFKGQDLGKRMDALAERVRTRYVAPTDDQIDTLVERGRRRKNRRASVA